MTPIRSSNATHERSQALRAMFEEVWARGERVWLQEWDTCKCKEPVPGPAYLRVRVCRRCQHTIR